MSNYEQVESVKERHLDRLLAMPNVTSVLVHYKRVGGQPTGELAIRVSVLVKRPRSSLSSDEVIPARIEGVPTDVYQAGRITLLAGSGSPARMRPLTGSIQILAVRPNMQLQIEGGAGTLSGFVRERQAPNRICGLTNYHVVCPGDLLADTGYEVFQPVLGDTSCGLCKDKPIGRVVGTAIGLTWDAATIALDPAAENTTLSYIPGVNEIGAVGEPRALSAVDINPASAFKVKKCGIRTHVTHGVIISGVVAATPIADDGLFRTMKNFIQIRSTEASMAFGREGDSGSLVLTDDDSNQPVALLFGRGTVTDPKEGTVGTIDGFACYFMDPPSGEFPGILNKLDVDFISGAGPGSPPIPVPADNMDGVPHRDSNGTLLSKAPGRGVVDVADEQLRRTRAGGVLADAIWQRRHEVVMLIRNDREFRKDWHRNAGPSLIQEMRSCLEDPKRSLPSNIRGRDTAGCASAILDSIRVRGSVEIVRDVEKYRELIQALPGQSFDDVLTQLGARL